MPLPPQLREEDYETIEAAVMETARGRWFLHEYARRNRAADTCTVLEAVARLEKTVGTAAPASNDISFEHAHGMIETIEKLHAELIAFQSAAASSGQPVQQILAVAEDIQETAWALRELGANPDFCEKLDRNAADIHAACSLQDMTGQHVEKIVQAVKVLEERLDAMTGKTAALPEDTLEQQAVYDIFAQLADTPALIDETHIIAPRHYHQLHAQKEIADLPKSSLPQLQAALATEWSAEDQEEISANNDSNPANFQLANYSFEEKLALFS